VYCNNVIVALNLFYRLTICKNINVNEPLMVYRPYSLILLGISAFIRIFFWPYADQSIYVHG